MGDGPARAARRRCRLVQGVRASSRRSSRASLPSSSHAGPTGSRRCSATTRSGRGSLLADAGTPIRVFGNPPGNMARRDAALLRAPARGSCTRARASRNRRSGSARSNAARHVTSVSFAASCLSSEDELRHLHEFAPASRSSAPSYAAHDVPETIQHDDLHHAERVLRWQTVAPPRLGRLVGRASILLARRHVPLPRGDQQTAAVRLHGSRGCATRIWSRGAAVTRRRSPSRCVSASSHMRSRGRVNGMPCRRRNILGSTSGTGSSFGARSPKRAAISGRPRCPAARRRALLGRSAGAKRRRGLPYPRP